MSIPFSSGKNSIAECDVCGFQYKLSQLHISIVNTRPTNTLVCVECDDEDNPQLQLGLFPVEDPQAVQNPRPDTSYYDNGNDGAGGSRMTQWGWNSVGGSVDPSLVTSNMLVGQSFTNSVTVA